MGMTSSEDIEKKLDKEMEQLIGNGENRCGKGVNNIKKGLVGDGGMREEKERGEGRNGIKRGKRRQSNSKGIRNKALEGINEIRGNVFKWR